MILHPNFSALMVAREIDARLESLLSYLRAIEPLQLEVSPILPQEMKGWGVVILTEPSILAQGEKANLIRFIEAGGGCLALVGLREQPLPAFFGVQPGKTGPEVELRVLFSDCNHPLATRLSKAFYLKGRHQPLQPSVEAAETILYADWCYQHSPMLVRLPVGEGQAACTTLQAYDDPRLQQILYRLLRQLAGQPNVGRTLGVGLLGYAPSVGRFHGLAVQATEGLELRAVCDLNPRRLDQAKQDFPDVRLFQSSSEFREDPGVDLAIIATPPNTHASLALELLEAGRHVVCEKPLAITRAETEVMLQMAEKQRCHLGCHQNRRWDEDYRAIRQAIGEGLIGELFYVETFVGGYSHPCGFWHSHAPISGCTTYDWGAHYLDWILSLIPERTVAVTCTRHNRVWHDITNADQERIQIRFVGGQEAEFLHSDIAAIRKPKWYLLGTEGAIIGNWRDVIVHALDPVLYFQSHPVPPTEMPPQLILQRRHPSGQLVEQKLAIPERSSFPFHHNLADHLLTAEPLAFTAIESARVVAVLEAATRSAAQGGALEELDV
jgi:predicted dehydrogenase